MALLFSLVDGRLGQDAPDLQEQLTLMKAVQEPLRGVKNEHQIKNFPLAGLALHAEEEKPCGRNGADHAQIDVLFGTILSVLRPDLEQHMQVGPPMLGAD